MAYLGLLLATFLLAWRAFGPSVAVWSLAPLTFASNGAVWLSGRITGGHLAAAAWHAGAFCLLAGCLERGGRGRALALGLWCGFGFYLDSMFAMTLLGLVPAAFAFWLGSGRPRKGALAALVFLWAFLAAVWPRQLGAQVDPHDAYRDQFALTTNRSLLESHTRTLVYDCLPRLLAGHRLPNLATEPDPSALPGVAMPWRETGFDPLGLIVTALVLTLAAWAVVALTGSSIAAPSPVARTVARGLLLSAAATLAGFVANRNIYNSDNYRYLVTLLVPWAVGFGLAMKRLSGIGKTGWLVAAACTVLLGALMTADLARWYARFRWVDARSLPVRRPLDDPTLGWLDAHPEVDWIEGSYWDVYRLAFLSGGRVRGVPFPVYPNRFPGWRPGPWSKQAVIVRPTPEGRVFRDAAIRKGGRVESRSRGVEILSLP